MLNVAFRYFCVDRLSPFWASQIANEGKVRGQASQTAVELTNIVKQQLKESKSKPRTRDREEYRLTG
jgi:hypothetical protein